MGLNVVRYLPDGAKAEIDTDVFEIRRRLVEGDPTLNWEGDDRMRLFYDEQTRLFEVWTLDAHGEPYRAAFGPRCDPSLISQLVANDTRHTDVFGNVIANNRKVDADRKRAFGDYVEGELADKLHFAFRRDGLHR